MRRTVNIAMLVALPIAFGLAGSAMPALAQSVATLRTADARWSAAIDSFRLRVRADVAADSVGGITAAVVVGDRMVWAEGFGWADRDRRIPAGVETIYRIGSISKSFTAVAMMRLVDAGVLSLDAPVAPALPQISGFAQPRPGAGAITFRHLASHTAGIVREPALEDAAAGPIEGWEQKVLHPSRRPASTRCQVRGMATRTSASACWDAPSHARRRPNSARS